MTYEPRPYLSSSGFDRHIHGWMLIVLVYLSNDQEDWPQMKIPRPLDKETLFEETHEGQGRIMESGGFYYAEAKKGDDWQLIQFSVYPQVARLALDHYLAEEF